MVWRPRFGLAAIVGTALLAMAREANGHSMAYYASTPISPPQGFTWVAFVFWVLLVGVNTTIAQAVWHRRWPASLALGAGVTALFSGVFFVFGAMSANWTTAPPPGLGWGYPVHWGLTHSDYTRAIFVGWNTTGVIFLVAVGLIASIVFSRRLLGAVAIVGADTAIYLLCLSPYIASEAWTHGWAGGYVLDRCEHQIEEMGEALVSYADEHDGRLPSANDIQELYGQLAPYLPDAYRVDDKPFYSCPVGSAFEPEPVVYVWNRRFSGAHLKDLEDLSPPGLLLACPYPGCEPWRPFALFTWDLFNPTTYYGEQYIGCNYERQLEPEEIWERMDAVRTQAPSHQDAQ